MGQGWSDSVSVAAYGSFTQSGFYLDALAGYAYFNSERPRNRSRLEGAAEGVIEITPEIIEAGVNALLKYEARFESAQSAVRASSLRF